MKLTYEVIEDNAGGIHFYAFDDDRCIYECVGQESAPESTLGCIRDLENGENPRDWDGGSDCPQKEYEEWSHCGSCGYKVIADSDGVYHGLMGLSGGMAFDATRYRWAYPKPCDLIAALNKTGLDKNQDRENGETSWVFADGSEIVTDGCFVDIIEAES
jgi:hypothetical protein